MLINRSVTCWRKHHHLIVRSCTIRICDRYLSNGPLRGKREAEREAFINIYFPALGIGRASKGGKLALDGGRRSKSRSSQFGGTGSFGCSIARNKRRIAGRTYPLWTSRAIAGCQA